MEASRVMEEWMDIVESVGGLSNLSRKTRSSFSALNNNRRRNESPLRRSAPPDAFNIAPRTCDLENLSSQHNNTQRSGKSGSIATRQSLVKQSLLEALGDLALADEVDVEEIVEEHVNEISLPSQLAEYYRERGTRRKSGRKVATTNLAALQEIVAETECADKTTVSRDTANARHMRQHSPHTPLATAQMAPESPNLNSSAAIEAMAGNLGQNIEWESELNQAVLDDVAASFRKRKASINESSSSSIEIQVQAQDGKCDMEDANGDEKRSSSLSGFVRTFSIVKQISANLASECGSESTIAASSSLGSSFPQLSLGTPATSTRAVGTPEMIPSMDQGLPPPTEHSDSGTGRRSSISNSKEDVAESTSTDPQGSNSSHKAHRPTRKRGSMNMVGLEIIVETANENGTVASKSKTSASSEAVHTQSTLHCQNKSTRSKSHSPSVEIPQEIKVKPPSSSSSSSPRSAMATSPREVSLSFQPIPSHRAAAIDSKKLEPTTPMPPADDACTSTMFGTLHQPWPELRAEESYRRKVESGAARKESKIKFISRQVSNRLAGEL